MKTSESRTVIVGLVAAMCAIFLYVGTRPAKPYRTTVGEYAAEVISVNGGTFVAIRPFDRLSAPIPATAMITDFILGPESVVFQPVLKVSEEKHRRFRQEAYAMMTKAVIESRLARK